MRHAGHDFAGLLQPDQHGPQRNASNKITCAVDGIDNPLAPIPAFAVRAFFSENAILGKLARQPLDDQLFTSPVGFI